MSIKVKINTWMQCIKKDTRIFAPGMCFDKLFLVFVVCSFLGVYYEQILNLITHYLQDGSIYWSSRRGVIYEPLSPIYGLGAIFMCYLLVRKHKKNGITFLKGFLFGGIFEYGMSVLQETFTHTTSWNYSHHFLNIGGRTTIPFMIFWGLLGLFFTNHLYPKLSFYIEKIPYVIGKTILGILLCTVSLDMFVSFTAILRQTLRREGIAPYTVIGKFYDQHYTDAFLSRYYPNMKEKKEKRK